jgi:hypothetical protein
VLAQALISPGKGSSSSPVPRSALDLIRKVDTAELCAHGATGRYTSNLEDLNVLSKDGLIVNSANAHLAIQVVAGQNGRNYFAHVTGRHLDTYVSRRPNFVDYGDSQQLSSRCPYPPSIVRRRLLNG